MKFLDKAALTSDDARKVPIEKLEIPELGGFVFVRGMRSVERDEWERSLRKPNGEIRGNFRARLVVRTAVNEQGERLFSDDDIQAVGKIRVDILQRICNVAQKLSGVSDQDADELGQSSDE
jgi:hypothetical protein